MMLSRNSLIQSKLEDLIAICKKHQVARLDLFGSASKMDEFDLARSDFDFLVEFQDLPPGRYADAYFDLLEELQILLNHPVDLVMTQAIKNRYFLEEIQSSRTVLYAA